MEKKGTIKKKEKEGWKKVGNKTKKGGKNDGLKTLSVK
jgi:hypothetical protein